jgi:uncharacterized protein YbjT (DUF2867 family)
VIHLPQPDRRGSSSAALEAHAGPAVLHDESTIGGPNAGLGGGLIVNAGDTPSKLMLVGATGVVGQEVLRLALADERVDAVVAPTRRPLEPAPRLSNPVVDLVALDGTEPWWDVAGVICTLGTTIRAAGSRPAFAAVDRDLPIHIAQLARRAGAERFALTSSVGASHSGSFYLRTKAEAEEGVQHVGFPSLTIVRPSLLDAERSERRVAERAAILLARALAPLIPRRYRAVDPRAVARALLEGALAGAPGCRVVESEELHHVRPGRPP